MTAPTAARRLYVHFPFCLSVCPYCDFVVAGGSAARGPGSRVAAFVDALAKEIELRGRAGPPLETVYLGGGTPSLMSAVHVARLLARVDLHFGIATGAEVTIEANPGGAQKGDLGGFRAAGVNRLSIGAQSFDQGELRRLGRSHGPRDIVETITAARAAGFDSVSLDLLYDVPGQTVDSWRATLDSAVALEPDHVSAYALTLDDPDAEGLAGPLGDHLPLRTGARRWRGRARLEQDDDRAALMYELADERLSRAGLSWYEISNWSRPGYESRHNLAYWLGGAWEAVGPGAHAFDGALTRRWNAARLEGYVEALGAGRLPPGAEERAAPATAAAVAATLRLRTRLGLDAAQTVADSVLRDGLAWGVANGLVERGDGGGALLTRRGRLLASELFVRLLPDGDRIEDRGRELPDGATRGLVPAAATS